MAQTTRKAELQLTAKVISINHAIAAAGQPIQALAIGIGYGGHIGGFLQPPFDLEAGDAALCQLRQQIPGGEVLGRHQIPLLAKVTLLAIDDQLIRKAARLSALTPVGAALPKSFAGEALTGISHTQGAVNEHLQRHLETAAAQLLLDALQIAQAQLTGQHHTAATQISSHGHPGGAADRHLRGAMHSQRWCELLCHPGQADVLHDQGIHTGGLGGQQQHRGLLQFRGKDQHIHGEKPLHTAAVQPVHHLWQIVCAEVFGPQAGIKLLDTEINGIGPVGDSGLEGIPAASRGE